MPFSEEENPEQLSRKNEKTMTNPVILQLTKERDNMVRQIDKREKEIAHFDERLSHSLMPNQIAMLKAQRTRQVTMRDADQDTLVNLETSLAVEIARRP